MLPIRQPTKKQLLEKETDTKTPNTKLLHKQSQQPHIAAPTSSTTTSWEFVLAHSDLVLLAMMKNATIDAVDQ